MEVQEFMRIVIYACTLLFGGLALWYQGNAKISGWVAALIEQAEELYGDLTKAGGFKFEWVVGRLYDLLRSLIEQIVQTTFDAIEGYAKMQLDRLTGSSQEMGQGKDCEVLR